MLLVGAGLVLAPTEAFSPPNGVSDRIAAGASAEHKFEERVAPGLTYRLLRFTRDGSPFTIHILEVDPTHPAINILPVRGLDRASGKETVSSMAKRYGATAATNGGYFEVSGLYAGTSHGVYQLNHQVISSGTNRSALVFCEETDYRERAEIDVVNFSGTVTAADGSSFSISGMNRPRHAQELVLYSTIFGPTTMADPPGLEVTVNAAGRIDALNVGGGNSHIPRGGYVLSASGDPAEWLKKHAPPGAAVTVDVRLKRATAGKSGCRPQDIVGGGPRLVRDGKIDVGQERFGHAASRHPRTAFAVTRKGTFLFLTLDGRQPSSAGMTLEEVAAELVAMGAVEAINLDGGGSTTMVVGGTVRNSPSDGQERPVSDAILIFSVPDLDALATLTERLGMSQIDASMLPRIRKILASARQSRRELKALIQLIRATGAREVTPAAARLLLEASASLLQEAKTPGN